MIIIRVPKTTIDEIKKVPTPGVSPTSKPLRMAYKGFILSCAAHSVKEVTLKSMDKR